MSEREPPGSIIERFRGTEWESPPAAPPPPPPRRGGSVVVVVVAMLAIGVLVGGIIVIPGLLGAPAPTHVFANPDVTPRVPDSIRVLEAFWKLARDPDLSYHLEGSGSSHADGFDASFELTLDVIGDDFTGTVNTIGGSGLAEYIRFDGVIYVRPEGGEWAGLRTGDAIFRQVPFMGIGGRRELAYSDRLVEDGMILHRLDSTEFYKPSVERMLDVSLLPLRPDVRSIELIVTDEGVPVRATFTAVLEPSLIDGIPRFEGSADYLFSDFGQAVVIQTPNP
ncbi:MAG TPA: hypothetical protein VF971_01665 [Candidatus Limnocylindrales bacterium]